MEVIGDNLGSYLPTKLIHPYWQSPEKEITIEVRCFLMQERNTGISNENFILILKHPERRRKKKNCENYVTSE